MRKEAGFDEFRRINNRTRTGKLIGAGMNARGVLKAEDGD